MIACYRREDPQAQPQLAVPITLTEHLLKAHQHLSVTHGPCQKRAHTADLCNVAIYYLLRVGEYAKPRTAQTNTIPFAPKDVTFRDATGRQIPNTSSLARLCQATEATIRMPNQKNGIKGQCIHQQCTGSHLSPIKSLARLVHHILTNGGNPATPIYSYRKTSRHRTWNCISATDINTALKQAAADIGLYSDCGYEPSDVSSHSLRAGGAMAMFLNGVDTATIQKMGRWKSNTFLMYIHEQISAFATGVSVKMANHIPFRCIAGPTLTAHN